MLCDVERVVLCKWRKNLFRQLVDDDVTWGQRPLCYRCSSACARDHFTKRLHTYKTTTNTSTRSAFARLTNSISTKLDPLCKPSLAVFSRALFNVTSNKTILLMGKASIKKFLLRINKYRQPTVAYSFILWVNKIMKYVFWRKYRANPLEA